MANLVVSPPVESIVVAALQASLTARGDTARVATKVPNPRPARLVRVTRAGGPRTDKVLESPLLLIECWDSTEVDAETLAGLIVGLVDSLEGQTVSGRMITAAEILGGPANNPDPDSASPRYTVTAQLAMLADLI